MISLAERLARMHHMDTYRIVRPGLANDVPSVRQWLRDHRDGGWQKGNDDDRMKAAGRLLWVVWLIRTGRLNGVPDDKR